MERNNIYLLKGGAITPCIDHVSIALTEAAGDD
jgi:hypothetical protein